MTFVGVSRDEIACKAGTILNSTPGQRLSVCGTNRLQRDPAKFLARPASLSYRYLHIEAGPTSGPERGVPQFPRVLTNNDTHMIGIR